jgi:cysteine desulfurase
LGIIYLDNAATTPVSPEVRAAMQPYFEEIYGNPSSVHQVGRKARSAIDTARDQVARAIGAQSSEIVFTSGGTEADNAAIIGTALAHQDKGKHIITTTIEHHAVLHTCEFLEKMGFEVSYVAPEANGVVSVEAIEQEIRPDTILITVMMVNNETGAVQPIAELGALTRERGIIFHTDAVQAAGVLAIDVAELGVDLLSISGHKMHGPKGIGALYVSKKIKWTPYLFGGSQEQERRAGTENLAGIVGLGVAIERATMDRESKYAHLQALRERMISLFQAGLTEFEVNGADDALTLPTVLNVTFSGISAEKLLMNLDMAGIAASAGSACTAGSIQPSHVLLAMGKTAECVKSSIRFSFSGQNTLDEVTTAAEKVIAVVQRLRGRSS